MTSALVTGVSSGIGRAIALALGGAGWRVFGSVRSAADARAFEAALPGSTACIFDVTDEAAVRAAAAAIGRELGAAGLDLLVNNAGISVNGPIELLPLARWREQLDVNVIGVVAVTQAFLPLLGAGQRRERPGRIINISSVAARHALPFCGPYAASKFAVRALSDSLRRELMVYGIDVIVIEPGAVRSEIWSKGAEQLASDYAGTAYGPALDNVARLSRSIAAEALPADRVGDLVLRILDSRAPRTRYVIQRRARSRQLLRRLLPDRVLDRLIARRAGLAPR